MKKFISGLLIGVLLMGTVTFAAPALTYVKSVFTTAVNGKAVKQSVVTIGGVYYADVKQLAGNLGIKYTVDTKTKKITLGETPVANKFSMSNPAPIGTMQTAIVKDLANSFTAKVTVKEIIRGTNAQELIKAENEFNEDAGEGFEYILAKIDFKLVDITKDNSYSLAGYAFNLISDKGKVYDYAGVVTPKPELDGYLYKGSSSEGYVVFKVGVNDKTPKIAFGRNYDGTGGIWFKAY